MANNKIELCTWYETATTIKNNNVDRSLYHLPSNGSLRYCQQNNAADRANVCRMPATKKENKPIRNRDKYDIAISLPFKYSFFCI